MRTSMMRKMALALAGIVGIGLCAPKANAAAFLWISAPGWSYSAAAAATQSNFAFFWGLSVGQGTFSFANAFAFDGNGSATAFAEASAGGLGGMGGLQVAGISDPFAGVGVDITLTDPSNSSGFPTSKPGSDPFVTPYTISGTGISLTGSGSEMNGLDGLEAFVYNGGTDATSLETALGASSTSGTTQAGDVTDTSTLTSDLGLIPLDNLIMDPSSLSSLSFTENTGDIDAKMDNVILVGIGEAAAPLPAALPGGLALLGLAGMSTLLRKRRIA